MNDAPHSVDEIAAFMQKVSSPEFKASQEPITIAEANRLRESFIGLNQQFNLTLQKLTAQRQQITKLESRVADLETEAKQLREHYKVFNTLREEFAAFKLDVLKQFKDVADSMALIW